MTEAIARLKTTGMHCSSCSMLVDLTVGDLPGVVSSKTDHASGDTLVSFDSDVVGVDAIIDAIREVGYDAEPVG
ncbi:MAG: heavy-metal-associated domain-containing protein [Coriobacteriia bacterium]|nr:heavy-metal-associated domain-containing protein [Coriobacteriia bacterium]